MGELNTKGGQRERPPGDVFLTPYPLVLAACRLTRRVAGSFGVIIEPSCGDGRWMQAAAEVWPEAAVIAGVEPNQGLRASAEERLAALPNEVFRHADGACRFALAALRWEDATELVAEARAMAVKRGAAPRVLVIGNPPYDLAETREKRMALPMTRRGEVPVTAETHVHLARERMVASDVLSFLLRQSFRATPHRVRRLIKPHPPAVSATIVPRPSFTDDGKSDGAEYEQMIWQQGYAKAHTLQTLLEWTPEPGKRARGRAAAEAADEA